MTEYKICPYCGCLIGDCDDVLIMKSECWNCDGYIEDYNKLEDQRE